MAGARARVTLRMEWERWRLFPILEVEENLWVIVQPSAETRGRFRAHCLNADIVSSSSSAEGALRALTEAIGVCMAHGQCPRRRASRAEWALLERVLREGQGGTPPSGVEVTAAVQLQLVRPPSEHGLPFRAAPRIQQLPWAWLEHEALRTLPWPLAAVSWPRGWARDASARAGRRASLERSRCGRPLPRLGSRGISMSNAPEIIVTTQDFERLQRLVACTSNSAAERLDAELARARLVAQTEVPADVVTMNSDVVYEDTSSGERRTVRLVYPKDAEAERGWVSVLAPVGAALLGLRQGQAIDWPVPRGTRRLRVLAVPYQPERHGHFTL
jgi:regulator of nucleoside diphosphate kinase